MISRFLDPTQSGSIRFSPENDIIVCHDFAYSEIVFNGVPPVSFMEIEGAKGVGVESHSFSKTYAMAGWRLGYVVGNREIIDGLAMLKSCVDSGVLMTAQTPTKM